MFPICSLLNPQVQNVWRRKPRIPYTEDLKEHISFPHNSEAKSPKPVLGGGGRGKFPPGFHHLPAPWVIFLIEVSLWEDGTVWEMDVIMVP